MSVLFHVPHASEAIPDDVCRGIVVDDSTLAREVFEATDHPTDGIVGGLSNGTTIRSYVNPWSRLVVDPERFLDPEHEITESVGRGVVATRTVNGATFRDATRDGFSDELTATPNAGIARCRAFLGDVMAQIVAAVGQGGRA